MKRNAAIEFFRLGMMFGIVLLHVITKTGYCHRGLDNLLSPCVLGFVFISGYFGIRFSWAKIGHLLVLAVFCSSFMYVFGWLWGLYEFSLSQCLKGGQGYWFLYAYIALMMLSPLLNAAVDRLKDDRRAMLGAFTPVVALIYGWSYASGLPIVGDWIPKVVGFGSLSLLSLVGAYLTARVIRLTNIAFRKTMWGLLLALSGAFVFAGFYHHNSPFALVLAMSLFMIIKELEFNSKLSAVVLFLAPSALSVYLLHCTTFGMALLSSAMKMLVGNLGVNVYLSYFIVAVLGFSVCLVADVARRSVLGLFRRKS